MDEITTVLLRVSKAPQDVHLAAAAHVQLSMLSMDGLLAKKLASLPEFFETLVDALESPCDFRIMAGLSLLVRVLESADTDCLDKLGSDVMPHVQDFIIRAQAEDIVFNLSVQSWVQWATLLYRSASVVICSMGRLAMSCQDVERRQIASHVLRCLEQITAESRLIFDNSQDFSGQTRMFFLAALQYDSAADRLSALRALYYSFRRPISHCWDRHSRIDRTSVYPLTTMTAADYTCITGQSQFYDLDTTLSDAERLLDVRAEFYDGMRALCTSHDFHALAETLYKLLLRDPRAVDFSLSGEQIFAGGKGPGDFQLPIDIWSGALRRCVDVLKACSQAASGHSHRHAANILELEDIIWHRTRTGVNIRASKLVKPGDVSEPWYWYALSYVPNPNKLRDVFDALDRLDAATGQNELAAVVETPLYQCTLANASFSGLLWVLRHDRDPDQWATLAEISSRALASATQYLRIAPFDGQHVATMNEVVIAFQILKRRPTFSSSPTACMSPIMEARWRAATATHARIWSEPCEPELEEAVATLYADWESAVRMYKGILDRHLTNTPPPTRTDNPDDMERGDLYIPSRDFSQAQIDAWRALTEEEFDSRRARTVCWREAPEALLSEVLQLHAKPLWRMRHCHNCYRVASVALRQCGACRQVRYCSKECQEKDWKSGHKQSCTRNYV
ncbi:hypothetical protein AURDEDRAFT_152120 [Auricularia subglabra TFB-10046 SS5]|uniref:MYND-type domain-containing protein n=1 Tax=Auricularia subglabra (strain TFB-10046 / SS5) TaxID=717982 RepID=J0LKW7_AURST|nr:hypothetical protein AURDEDRAFT_152120 [Auricularia subglabra TFB-10046 SS5]